MSSTISARSTPSLYPPLFQIFYSRFVIPPSLPILNYKRIYNIYHIIHFIFEANKQRPLLSQVLLKVFATVASIVVFGRLLGLRFLLGLGTLLLFSLAVLKFGASFLPPVFNDVFSALIPVIEDFVEFLGLLF